MAGEWKPNKDMGTFHNSRECGYCRPKIPNELTPFYECTFILCMSICDGCGRSVDFESDHPMGCDGRYLDEAVAMKKAGWVVPKIQTAFCPECASRLNIKHNESTFIRSTISSRLWPRCPSCNRSFRLRNMMMSDRRTQRITCAYCGSKSEPKGYPRIVVFIGMSPGIFLLWAIPKALGIWNQYCPPLLFVAILTISMTVGAISAWLLACSFCPFVVVEGS